MNQPFALTSVACALLLGAIAGPAAASTPASDDITLPVIPGQTVVVEWTGTALPGASGAGNACPAAGPDDAHTINLVVPEGAYDSIKVSADFHVEWDDSPAVDPTGTVHDPDLVLTVLQGTTDLGSSDGGSPQENVGLANPASGAYKAVVCPFFATAPTAYRGKLTLTALAEAACLVAPSKAIAHSTVPSAGSFRGDDEMHGLPNFDWFQSEAAARAPQGVPAGLSDRYQSALFDPAMGLPTFLWAQRAEPAAAVGPLTEKAQLVARAREHLRREAKMLKLSDAAIDDAQVIDAQYNGDGPAVVRFRQRAGGLEVYGRTLNVLLNRAGKPVAVSGYFASAAPVATVFARTPQQAIASAWTSLGGTLAASQLTRASVKGDYAQYAVAGLVGSHVMERQPRIKPVYYPRVGGLDPAYYVELFALSKESHQRIAYGMVLSAADGRVFKRTDLISEAAFTYRVFADAAGTHQPYDSPLGNGYVPFPGATADEHPVRVSATANLVTLEHGPIKTADPWLADDAAETTGNHVDACIDTYDTQGVPIAVPPPVNACVSGVELRAEPTSDHTFDYPISADEDPSTASAQNAAVVSMFYLTNWLHDWWYDHGFDEASGNAQTSNYGRGGEEGDPLLAQGQDGSGRNNANMATPADGSSPVMQQYLFNGPIKGAVTITAPAIGEIPFNGVEYGPQTFDYTGVAVLANDGFDPAGDGCTGLSTPAVPVELPVLGAPPQVPVPVLAPDPNLAGKIAVIDRGGGCPGSYKVRWALLSGASAVMLVHNADGPPPFLANGDVPIDAPVQPTNNVYQLPIVTIRKDDGQRIKDAIAAGQAVTVHLKRDPSVDFDGTLDNLIIAHEYFHYVHHRLTESSNPQADAMSEGWGDIDAFMLSARADDRAAPGNEHFQGAYAAASYVTNDFYFGIRRAPYSTDLRKNPLTFKHISEGEALPQGEAPVNGDPTGNGNSEVHSAGEIWANAVWECYTGLLNDPRHSFEQAQSRMQDYIIGGLKMTPADATYTEARDAILAVALANDVQDYKACSRGFAKRGMGLNAVSPARASTDLVGVVEDYSEFVCAGGSALPVPTPVGGGGTVDQGRYGGGALNLVLILPLLGLALRRRRPRAAQARKG